jgi:Glycosyl transferase family 90
MKHWPLLASQLRQQQQQQQQQHRTISMTKNSSNNRSTNRFLRRPLLLGVIAVSLGAFTLFSERGSLLDPSRTLAIKQPSGGRQRTDPITSRTTPPPAATTLLSTDDSASSNSRKLAVCVVDDNATETTAAAESSSSRSSNSNSSRSIIKWYLSIMESPGDWVLFKWNADGTFDHARAQTRSLIHNWAPTPDILGDAEPSAHGRIVLLLNSDRTLSVPWKVRPPVPVWVYSKPISPVDPRNISETLPERCELDRVTLVPTPYDFGVWNRFCIELVERNVQRKTFAEKINQVVWRGAIHAREVERSRVTLLQFAAQTHGFNETSHWLDAQEVTKSEDPAHMEFHELAEYRYHIDIGGLSGTAWGGLRWKLCTGLLVFKVESWANDWWYDTLEPWTHYIPVRPDVSDLHERYQWTQDNPEKAQEIAEAGRQRCLETLGEEKAKEQYQAAVRQLPAAEASVIMEAEEILEQMMVLETDMRGILTVTAGS